MSAPFSSEPRSLTVHAPAKINLVLAITGVRTDGFHELTSLVAPVAFGDTLRVVLHGTGVRGRGDGGAVAPNPATDTLHCDAEGVPTDASNLVLKAAAAFRAALAQGGHSFEGRWEFFLEKRIPAEAGLGGGSSDAAVALMAMNHLCGDVIGRDELYALAATIGSDCPLFIAGAPVIMRGRGEQLTFLDAGCRKVLSGQRVLLFKPSFSINTGWAYGQMKAAGGAMYVAADAIEDELAQWQKQPQAQQVPLFNNMQIPAFAKYLALPTLLEALREQHAALRCMMSGSGSACFALLDGATPPETVAALKQTIRDSWGADAFCEDTTLL